MSGIVYVKLPRFFEEFSVFQAYHRIAWLYTFYLIDKIKANQHSSVFKETGHLITLNNKNTLGNY